MFRIWTLSTQYSCNHFAGQGPPSCLKWLSKTLSTTYSAIYWTSANAIDAYSRSCMSVNGNKHQSSRRSAISSWRQPRNSGWHTLPIWDLEWGQRAPGNDRSDKACINGTPATVWLIGEVIFCEFVQGEYNTKKPRILIRPLLDTHKNLANNVLHTLSQPQRRTFNSRMSRCRN